MKEIKLIKNERIDDLQLNGLKIIQNTEGFCFGIDSVILSEFAKNIKNNANVVDLGTGTGILGFLLCGKTNLKTVTGIEIQENKYDVVITNPPYKELGTGIINIDEKKLISRHEIKATLFDFINIASQLLKDKGELYMVHKAERLVDIIDLFRKNNIEPKELRNVYSKPDEDATLVLIKGIKGGKKFLKIKKPLYIYEKNGEYSEEIKK